MKTITVSVKAYSRAQARQFRLRVEQDDERFLGQPMVHRALYEMARSGEEADRAGAINEGRGMYQLLKGPMVPRAVAEGLGLTDPELAYVSAIAGAIVFESMYQAEVEVSPYAQEDELEARWEAAVEESLGSETRDYDRFAASWSRSLRGNHYDGGD